MNVAAIVDDIVRETTKPPTSPGKRVRLCQYDKAFCGSCLDREPPPCALEGGYWDCETCTVPGCPCMRLPTSKRQDAYQIWQDRLSEINAQITARKARRHQSDYKTGRKCSSCEAPITDKSKSGMCLPCRKRHRA